MPVKARLIMPLVTVTWKALAIGTLPPPEAMMSKLLSTVLPWAVTLKTRCPAAEYVGSVKNNWTVYVPLATGRL